MSTKSEIQGMIDSIKRRYNSYRSTVADCNAKIDRLKPVYKKLGEMKKDFNLARKETKQVFKEKGNWHGEKYKAFCNAGDTLDDACDEYYKRLDKAHDAINTKIHNLQAEKSKLDPLLGGLWGKIKDLEAELKNATN